MTNKSINKTSYISLTLVQNKVLNGGGYYLLTNLKLNSFLHEIKWIESFYPFLLCIKGGIIYAEKTNNISSC